MSDIYVTLEGYGKAHLTLDLVDSSEDGEVEVWRGTFREDNSSDETLWEVYFEMDPTSDYEALDLISEAIHTYKLEAEDITDEL